jgi:hypothetical protein
VAPAPVMERAAEELVDAVARFRTS